MNPLREPGRPDVDARLRQDLRAIADLATAPAGVSNSCVPKSTDPFAEEDLSGTQLPSRRSRRQGSRRKRWVIGIGAVCVPAAVAAAATVRFGPEYVDRIPPETVIVQGTVDGDRYLLVESRRTACGVPVDGVELVEEDENLLGSEWNTVGSTYGEPRQDGCGVDTGRYLRNPALYDDGGTQVGDSMVWLWAVHPDVTAVRITADGFREDLRVHRVDGAGYALFEVPRDISTYAATLMIGADPVPGSAEVHKVPAP